MKAAIATRAKELPDLPEKLLTDAVDACPGTTVTLAADGHGEKGLGYFTISVHGKEPA